MDLKLEQRANIKFFVKLGISATETFEAMSGARCFERKSRFKSGRTSLEDDKRSGRPSTSTTPKNVYEIARIVRQNRRIIIKEVADMVNVLCGSVLRRLRENIRCKRPELWRDGNWLLQRDNAPAHSSLKTREFLCCTSTIVAPHPPYSPHLAPCDFFLLPKIKFQLKCRRFDSMEEIQWETQMVLDTLKEPDFQGAL